MATTRLFQASKALNKNADQSQADLRHELSFKTSSRSNDYTHFYTADNVITLFLRDDSSRLARYSSQADPSICFEKAPLRYGHRPDTTHSCWHHSIDDTHQQHMHIIKGDFELVTPKEFQCFLDQIRLTDLGDGRCQDGETQCALIDTDADKLIQKFKRYYQYAKNNAKELSCSEERMKLKIELHTAVMDCTRLYAGAHILALINTLLDRYVKPYLITHEIVTPKNATTAVGLAKNALVSLISGSRLITIFDAISQGLIKPLLVQTGINTDTADVIIRRVSAIASVMQNPVSIGDILLAGSAATSGEMAAMSLIHQLPKLRTEPAVASIEPVQVIAEPHPTLRQRHGM